MHHFNGSDKISAYSVQLVDKSHFGYAVLVGLAPYGFGLRFHAFHRAENTDHSVEHPQGAFDFNGKIHVPRCVYNVNFVICPLTGCDRRRNRYTPFLFINHPIHHCFAIMDLADFMRATRVVQNTLGYSGLARINMRNDADISDGVDFGFFLHRINSIFAFTGSCRSICPARVNASFPSTKILTRSISWTFKTKELTIE